MPISDLTGTKWVLNENLVSGLSLSEFYYNNINFTSGGLNFTSLSWWDPSSDYDDINTYQLDYNGDSVETIYRSSGGNWVWANQSYRTIEITGGTDATNATLIEWLEANATQVIEPSVTPSISIGSLSLSDVYVGNTKISKIFLGSTLLWENEARSLLAPTISLYDSDTALKIESANDEEDQYEIYVDGVLVGTFNKFYDFKATSNTLTKCIGRQYYTGEIVTPQTVNGTSITTLGSGLFGGAVASKITISEGVTLAPMPNVFDNDTTTVNVVFPSTIRDLKPLNSYPQTTVNIGLPGYIEYEWTTALPNGGIIFTPNPNATNINFYIKSTIVTLNDSCLQIGYLSSGPTTTINLYFDESENETMTIGTNLIYAGAQKFKMTYNVYTDNASIKDALLTYAGQYCTVNVYKRNGGAW